eukprot:14957748-Alexandrium_andersonii.AAC.1
MSAPRSGRRAWEDARLEAPAAASSGIVPSGGVMLEGGTEIALQACFGGGPPRAPRPSGARVTALRGVI